MSTLHLHATRDAAEAAWRALLGGEGAVELGRTHLTPRELVEAAHAARPDPTDEQRLGPLGEILLIDAIAESADGVLAGIATSRGLRRSLGRIFVALGKLGLGARELQAAARAVGGVTGAHAEEVARLLGAYHKQLAARQLHDEAAVWRLGCEAIARGLPLAALEVDGVEVHGVYDWDGPRLALLDALLGRGLAVRVRLPASAGLGPLAARALEPALAALEARHGATRLERVEEASAAAAALTATVATSPADEARAVARRVRDLLDGGVAPESIAVCAATPERRARLEQALLRYGVPVASRRPASAANAPPVRIALELLALVEDHVPRERLIAVLSSRYVAGNAHGPNGWLPPHRLARALRESGYSDARGDGYSDRLRAWAAGQPVLQTGEAEAICRHIDMLVERLRAAPAEATITGHVQYLMRLLDRFELFAHARGFRGADAIESGAETRAIARDQAAVRELEVALTDLPRAAVRAGIKGKIARARFARLLGEWLATSAARTGGVRGAAVELTDLVGVTGRRFAHLFACGLIESELPLTAPEDPLLGDDERAALNRALGGPALPLAARATAQHALAFAVALGDGAEVVHLSWTRGDEDGAPLLRSPLVDELAIPAEDTYTLPRQPIPRARDARTFAELTARVALECRGDRLSRLSPPDLEVTDALYPRLAAHDPSRFARLEHLIAMEQQRYRYFLGAVPAHAYVGGLRDGALLPTLAERLPGRLALPLSAKSLESYAACPFQFFVRSVLRVHTLEEADDEIDPLSFGRLHHRVLERFFRRLQDDGRLPLRGEAADLDLLDEVCDDVVDEWRRTEPIGHPALFHVKERRLREQLAALVRAEAESPPAEGCVPAHFEHRFGPLPVASESGDEHIYVGGTIDRIDVGPGRAVVIDYKTGRRASYVPQLADDALCVTAWQLPVYAAAARAELGVNEVEACFYSLRDAARTRPVTASALIALDGDERNAARAEGRRNLADSLWQVHRAMRGGDFAVRPREEACERCGLDAACRVRQLKLVEDDL